MVGAAQIILFDHTDLLAVVTSPSTCANAAVAPLEDPEHNPQNTAHDANNDTRKLRPG